MVRILVFIVFLGCSVYQISNAQIVYIVNFDNDVDDGVCDVVHCSLREAIKASEADGRASNIRFNITGANPHVMVPSGPLPTINGDSTDISFFPNPLSEYWINFSYRDFGGIPFLQINGNFTTINGLSFTKMLFNSNNDHILKIGTAIKDATDTRISSNSFFEDNSIVAGINRKSIDIVNASNLLFDSNSLGLDLLKNIYSTEASILIEPTQGVKPFSVVNNIFLTKVDAID